MKKQVSTMMLEKVLVRKMTSELAFSPTVTSAAGLYGWDDEEFEFFIIQLVQRLEPRLISRNQIIFRQE